MQLDELIRTAAENYNGKEAEFKKSANIIRNKLPQKIRLLLQVDKFTIKGSVGIGGKAETPWLAVLKPAITGSTQKGYYVVYLFNPTEKTMYLSLAVGWMQFAKDYNFKEATERIKEYSTYLAKQLRHIPHGFFIGKIDLSAKGQLTMGYENGQILSKKYNTENLPNEKDMLKDLKAILNTYDELSLLAGNDITNIDYEAVTKDKKIYKIDRDINQLTLENDILSIENRLRELVTHVPPSKRKAVINRAVRNPKIAKLVKEKYKYICQVCGRKPFTQKNGQPYAEADHIRPLGAQGDGLDSPENIRCLCAQCHAIITFGSDDTIKALLNR
jgi:5-methylcytosine-specific restriction protein A